MSQLPGALVISLDFELHWGVCSQYKIGDRYSYNLYGAREVIPRLLDLFTEFDIAATWATVGFLFSENRHELQNLGPVRRPKYFDRTLSTYNEEIGFNEGDDPLHFAPSLIKLIKDSPRQEIGTHTFSHFFCCENGQTKEDFDADIEAAVAIAAKRGISIRSIVFPRNQFNPGYLEVLRKHGLKAYRGNPTTWMWRFSNSKKGRGLSQRVGRLTDAYFPISADGSVEWCRIPRTSGLSNVAASRMLRPYEPRTRALEVLRRRRLSEGIRSSARLRKVFHLWWHPHNFGRFPDENLAFLRSLLIEFKKDQARYGMQSLNMANVDDIVRSEFPDLFESQNVNPLAMSERS